MGNTLLCTCCTPRTVLAPATQDTAEPRLACPVTGVAYALRDGLPIALGIPVPAEPWTGSAGPQPLRTTRIDLSRAGYS
jgi:uncharacterized protein YbaR (Trm112 family)